MAKGIQAEIKQNKPFSGLEEETVIALARTSDLLGRRLDALLKQHGLTGTQYNVLRILRGAGNAGLPCSEIGERMVTRDPDITRLLDRVERGGLCTRSRHDKDRRVIVAQITAKGLNTLKHLDGPIQQLNQEMLGHMGQNRLRSLLRLLQAIRGG
jgi:MarR family transcriptional regulator, organic hydroperoxide resistance regulator